MSERAKMLRERRIDEAYEAELRVVRRKSTPYAHYAAMRSVTLCGAILQKERFNRVPDLEFDCPWCQAVIDIICDEFAGDGGPA